MSNLDGKAKKSIQRQHGGVLPNVAVSIQRQSSRYNMVPAQLDYTERYHGSVGKLQRDVETQKIKIPSCGDVQCLHFFAMFKYQIRGKSGNALFKYCLSIFLVQAFTYAQNV